MGSTRRWVWVRRVTLFQSRENFHCRGSNGITFKQNESAVLCPPRAMMFVWKMSVYEVGNRVDRNTSHLWFCPSWNNMAKLEIHPNKYDITSLILSFIQVIGLTWQEYKVDGSAILLLWNEFWCNGSIKNSMIFKQVILTLIIPIFVL